MMVPPRKRKEAHTLTTTTFSIGNCRVEIPSNVEQDYSTEEVCLQVFEPSSITISVDKWRNQAFDCLNPCYPGRVLPMGLSFQLLNPKGLDEEGKQLLEGAVQLYQEELPAMSFAANTGKVSDFLENCTTNGKYCTLLMTKPGATPTDTRIVVGAITYQILPPDTQFAEILLAAVDQTCQRKGLGSLLFRELARRLADVGVLTLFCWGDQESEIFWSKQGFLKIAEVDSRGKPQKLPLKAEIRKAMSLPGSAALMVCNLRTCLPQLNSTITSMSTGDKTPVDRCGTINPTSVRAESDSTHGGTQVTPMAGSKTSETYSPAVTPCRVPPCSDLTPDQIATVPTSSRNSVKADARVKAATARGSGSNDHPVMTNPVPGSKPSAVKSHRTLRFAGVDENLITTRPENGVVPPNYDGVPSASGMQLKSQSPGLGIATVPEVLGPRPALLMTPATEMPCEDTAPATPSNLPGALPDVDASRQPLRDMKNSRGNGIVAPVKKRPWKRAHCENSNSAASSPASHPHAIDADSGPNKENNEPAIQGVTEAEQQESGSTLKVGQKRYREEPFQVKVVGRRSTRRRRGGDTVTSKPVSKEPDVLMSEPAALSKPALAPQSSHVVNLEAGRNSKAVSGARNAEIVDCKQSMADDSFSTLECSPSNGGDEQMILRMKKQKNDPTIRKRLATRLVHVPEVPRELSWPLASELDDPVKASRFVIFLMNMSNDSRKAALVQMVEKLGGRVTNDGGQCTHVVTGEVRRTLNFCTALCNGAWVVTPDWLKASSRHRGFVDEKPYLLKDRQFETKYEVTLASVVHIARQRPCSLFSGFYVYPTPHVQPPLNTVIKLTQAAGGKIVSSLDEALRQDDPSHTIVLACEEDMEEGIVAAKAGLRTFDGEWFMQSIVKQTLDMRATFSEQH